MNILRPKTATFPRGRPAPRQWCFDVVYDPSAWTFGVQWGGNPAHVYLRIGPLSLGAWRYWETP